MFGWGWVIMSCLPSRLVSLSYPVSSQPFSPKQDQRSTALTWYQLVSFSQLVWGSKFYSVKISFFIFFSIWASLEPFVNNLGLFWCHLGPFGSLGPLRKHLWPLETIWESFGNYWGPFGSHLGPFGSHLGLFESHLGAFGSHLWFKQPEQIS